MSAPLVSATGAVFSNALLPENEKSGKDQVTATVNDVQGSDSTETSRAPSVHDAEKAEGNILDDEKALAKYLVPALEKGRKNALLKKPTPWIRFRVWYNPYRMVRSIAFFSARVCSLSGLLDVVDLVRPKHDCHHRRLHPLLGIRRKERRCVRSG